MAKRRDRIPLDAPHLSDWEARAHAAGWQERDLIGLRDCLALAASRNERSRVVAVDAARIELVTEWTSVFVGTAADGRSGEDRVARAQRWTWTRHQQAEAVVTDRAFEASLPGLLPTGEAAAGVPLPPKRAAAARRGKADPPAGQGSLL